MGRAALVQVRRKSSIETQRQSPPLPGRRHRGSAARQRQQHLANIQRGIDVATSRPRAWSSAQARTKRSKALHLGHRVDRWRTAASKVRRTFVRGNDERRAWATAAVQALEHDEESSLQRRFAPADVWARTFIRGTLATASPLVMHTAMHMSSRAETPGRRWGATVSELSEPDSHG